MCLGRLRTITVFVVGKLKTRLYGIFHSSALPGGQVRMGRWIFRRNGVTITNFDFMILLKDKTIRLLPEDVIFLTACWPLTTVIGYVNTPAIYELKEEATVKEVIALAGG